MTVVSWGTLDGNTLEDFLAALLLLRFRDGTRITPSQGDQGVDIKVPTEGGFDVYQIKKYATALSTGQAAKVKKSWKDVNDEFGANNTITAWYLVMPWDPTAEREEWFNNLTKDAGFPCYWRGLSHLNGWASENQRLVEYFFGNGVARLQEQMATLMTGSAVPEGGSDAAKLDIVTQRYAELQQVLDAISPFYRYLISLVPAADLQGILDAAPVVTEGQQPAITTYRRISDDFYVGMSVTAISEEATVYDPISVQVEVAANDETQAAELARFFEYGIAPQEPVPAVVVEATGPPGATPDLNRPGWARLTDTVVPSSWESFALLAFLDNPDTGAPDHAGIELGPLVTTVGQVGRAMRAEGQALGLELRVKPTGEGTSLSTWAIPIAGKLPHRVLPELVFAQLFWSGEHPVTVSVPNGPMLVSPIQPPARLKDVDDAKFWADIAGALRILQQFTLQQLKMPNRLTGKEAQAIRSAAELVVTGATEEEWESLRIVRPAMPLNEPVALIAFWPARIKYDDQTFELDFSIRQECDAVEAIEVAQDYMVVRPTDGSKMRQRLIPRSEYDYRVMAGPVQPADSGAPAPEVRGVDELTQLTVPALKELARVAGITGYSKLRKHELVEALTFPGLSGAGC